MQGRDRAGVSRRGRDDDVSRDRAVGADVRIEPAAEAELEAIAALAGRIWRRHYPGIITDEQIDYMLERGYALPKLREQITTPGRGLDVLKVDGEIVGFANWHATDDPAEVKLDKLYLAQEHQGKGFGSRLIEHVARAARERGAVRLVLNVNKHNRPSIRVYERNGFRIREAVVVDIGNGFVMDDYAMEKDLAADDPSVRA